MMEELEGGREGLSNYTGRDAGKEGERGGTKRETGKYGEEGIWVLLFLGSCVE